MTVGTVVVLVIVVFAVWSWVLPWLWGLDSGQAGDQHASGDGKLSKKHPATDSGVVRIIRLTDDGEFVKRGEFADAVIEIRNCPKPEIIVWYVHGWNHNADEADSNRRHFESLIKELAEHEKDHHRVVGIYVAWDGAVGPAFFRRVPVFSGLWMVLSFWNRKRAADRISQSAVLTRILAATKNAREQRAKAIPGRDLTILIGHSFGARMLYTSTSQVLIDAVQRQHPGEVKGSYGVIAGPADLILLLNPAFEASAFTTMDSIRRDKQWEQIDAGQQPILLAISSKNDWANRALFPLGQLFVSLRKARQRKTLGNCLEYVTHSLLGDPKPDGRSGHDGFWFDRFTAHGLVLQRTGKLHEGNPFMVARTTRDVIDGHNGIWEGKLRDWMIAFLLKLHERASSKAGESSSHR